MRNCYLFTKIRHFLELKHFFSIFFFLEILPIMHRECEPLVCLNYELLQGPTTVSSPVCASNGYTYGNIHQVRCLKDFIPSI